MTKRAALLTIALLLLISGCGYRIVLTGTSAAFTVFPQSITNNSNDINASAVFTDAVKLYMATNNMIEDKSSADYIGDFTLESVDYNSSSNSTTASARAKVKIEIKNKSGEQVFSKVYNTSDIYTGSETEQTEDKRAAALTSAVEKVMQVFRNEFE